LSVPYRLEPLGKTRQPLGLLGARASLYLDTWRIRPALVYRTQDGQVGGVLSARKDFSDFELETHITYLERFAASLAGSGLLGDTVIYGEGWLLTDPLDARGALGLSGFWGDALWTLEASYAENALVSTGEAFPQLLGQLNLPQGESSNLDINLGLGLTDSVLEPDSSALQGLASVRYTYSEADYQLSLGSGLIYSDLATLYNLRLSLIGFF
jgi:hypothetical protein